MMTLKQYAQEAKARLKSGFWEQVKEQRDYDVQNAIRQGKSPDVVYKEYREVLTRKIFENKNDEDEILYQKVCELLSQNQVITNPIGLLADEEKMKDMTPQAKQNYIFQLSAKFKEMKERYHKESQLSIKAKTMEEQDSVGQKLAISTQSVVLLKKK